MDGAEVWDLRATHGLPLDVILEELYLSDVYPKWDELIAAAVKDGANKDRFINELKMHAEYTYPNKAEMLQKLERLR